jgi:DNA-binding CsgD family transcriptional regulator
MPPGPGHSHIRAAEILIEVLTGDPRTAIRPATELLATLPTGGPARALVSAARALAWAMTGEVSRVHLAVDEGRTALRSGWRVTEALLVQAMLTYAELTALFLAGRLDRMAERSAEFHRRALSVPAWAGDAVSVLDCGWTALARGRWRDALRWLGEAHAGFQRRDPAGLRPVCGALLATGRALVGDPGGVRELLEEAGDDDSRMLPLFRPLGAMARACGAAAEARVREAVQLSISGAELAAAHGNLAAEAVLLHHAVRFGAAATVAPLLESLAGRVDAPLIGDMAAHARAAAAGDGDRLVAASSRLESAGALLYSADAALEAAAVYERTGARRLAGECRTRAMALARECGVSDTPALDSLSLPNLTSREREVASLASSGLSNQDIADRLVLSVRTVETHLSHVYTKFGITSRAELVAALAARGQVTRVPGAASPEATTGVIIG